MQGCQRRAAASGTDGDEEHPPTPGIPLGSRAVPSRVREGNGVLFEAHSGALAPDEEGETPRRQELHDVPVGAVPVSLDTGQRRS